METKLNIAEILKDKPKGTKLYADAFGKLSLECVTTNLISTRSKVGSFQTFYDNGKYSEYGDPILVPSKEMQDWSKFAWKKGDVLVSNDSTTEVIFKGWKDDTYTLFCGAYALTTHKDGKVEYGSDSLIFETCNYKGIEVEDAAQCYINYIEKRLGGKLNLETLEIEKPKPEFKDGDILAKPSSSVIGKNYIFILKEFNKYKDFKYYVALTGFGKLDFPKYSNIWSHRNKNARYATKEEKQQFFDALAKKGVAWDAEKKEIVNLKAKVEFKPFEKVLVRDEKDANLGTCFFLLLSFSKWI